MTIITNDHTNLEEEYFLWLFDLIRKTNRNSKSAMKERELLRFLHSKEFTYSVGNDDNRASDGIEVRHRFYNERGSDTRNNFFKTPCTVLEMLVALAIRMDYSLGDNSSNNELARWFWVFIKNLGLEEYSPDDPHAEGFRALNGVKVDKFLSRTYSSNGKGGIFPLRKPAEDQRGIEIWYQLMSYMDENYVQY